EDQGRYLAAVPDPAALLAAAAAAGVPARLLGQAGPGIGEGPGDAPEDGSGRAPGTPGLTLPDGMAISLRALAEAHERFFPALMDR
ncbi:MAG: hypothetical protein ACRYHQ_10850, partial [Janthinobacterium lividum]